MIERNGVIVMERNGISGKTFACWVDGQRERAAIRAAMLLIPLPRNYMKSFDGTS